MATESEQEKRETLADIVAAMHNDAELYHAVWLNDPNENPGADEVSRLIVHYAMRVEAALNREREVMLADAAKLGRGRVEVVYASERCDREAVTGRNQFGNAAAIREALDAALRFIGNLEIEPYSPLDEAASELRQRIMDALALPRRNCDVGTAEEQANRFGELCGKCYDEEGPCNEECPLASLPIIHGFPRCQAYWAQMLYAAKEGAGE